MASFVEQATLKVNDQSTAQINKINAALKKLFTTARSLKSVKVNINVNTNGLQAANKQVNALARNLGILRRQTVALNVNAAGLTKARRDIMALRALARAPINVNVRGVGGGAGGGRALPPPTPRAPAAQQPRRRGGRTPGGAIISGAGAGGGISGVSRLENSFGALSLAAYGAAAALRKIGEAGLERSRTELQTRVMASAAQQAVYAAMPPSHQGAAIPFTQNQFEQLRNEIAGDVADKDERQTARNADAMTRFLQNELYPGIVARNPTQTPEQAGADLKKIVKAAGMSTSEMFKGGELTADAKRFFTGVQTALAVNPDIAAEKIRTTVAGLRTAGLQMEPDAIARSIVQAGDKGARVGNEAYQFQQAMRGIFKNKALNNALAARGVLQDGKVRDADLLGRNPAEWAYKEFQKDVNTHLDDPKTRERIAKRVQGGEDESVARQNEAVNVLTRLLPSARQTVTSFLAEAILGREQWERQRAQAGVAADPAEAARQAAKTPAIMWENLKTAANDAAGALGSLALSSKAATGIMEGLTNILRGQPTTPEQKGALAVGGITAAAAGVGLGRLLLAPATALNGSAARLTGAAGALTRAAAAQSRGALPGGAAGAPGGPVGRGKQKFPSGGTLGGAPAAGGGVKGAALGAAKLGAFLGPVGITVAIGSVVYENLPEDIQTKIDEGIKKATTTALDTLLNRNRPQDAASSPFAPSAPTVPSPYGPGPGLFGTPNKPVPVRIEEGHADIQPPITPRDAPTPAAINAARQAFREEPKPMPLPASPIPVVVAEPLPPVATPPEPLPPVATPPEETPQSRLEDAFSKIPQPLEAIIVNEQGDDDVGGGAGADTLSTLLPGMEQTSNSIVMATSNLTNSAGTFESVFSTGAQGLVAGGQNAANVIASGAAAAGAAYGAAAASAIQAAVANVNVNVNVKGGGADQGNINNANGNK